MLDLAAELPRLLPKAIAWAEDRAADAMRTGVPLSLPGLRVARAVGVRQPERVRVQEVAALPIPDDPELRSAAFQTGLLGPGMLGVTFDHAILVVTGYRSSRLLSHECRHVYQYEVAGSIAAFMPIYLHQIVMYGYTSAPLEVDARAHELDLPDGTPWP